MHSSLLFFQTASVELFQMEELMITHVDDLIELRSLLDTVVDFRCFNSHNNVLDECYWRNLIRK